MRTYRLEFTQLLHVDIDKAWGFFSDPARLKDITPPYMGFEIKSPIPVKMYAGMIIEYIVRPLLRIPVRWLTEISHAREPEYFVDEQRSGPYKFWHHQHIFEATDEGTLMRDIVTYSLPIGIIGRFANSLFVRNKIKEIFEYRRQVLNNIFKQSS